MMREEELLVRAMDKDRHDDTPRIALTDWLKTNRRFEEAEYLLAWTPPIDLSQFGIGDGSDCRCSVDKGGDGAGRGHIMGGYGTGQPYIYNWENELYAVDGYGGGSPACLYGGSDDGGRSSHGGSGDGGGEDGSGYYSGGRGDGGKYNYSPCDKEISVTNGLYILSIATGTTPYVLIGWVECAGLTLKLRNARCIRSFGTGVALATLAVNGLQSGKHGELLPMSDVEYVWRPNVSRAIAANPDAWTSECPKPQEWKTLSE